MSKYIVTGYAGFIGYHLTKRLLEEGHEVVGIDNFNDYYPVKMKCYRLQQLTQYENEDKLIRHHGYQNKVLKHTVNILDESDLRQTMCPCDAIFHLAAIPGVRKSFENPAMYVENNITGSINVLKAAGEYGIGKVILASSSSVYGDQGRVLPISQIKYFRPSNEDDCAAHPYSPYAMTKRAMEMISYTYHDLYDLDVIIPRFFTVYGPAGRPDMAYYKFTKAVLAGESIDVYGDGEQVRDFTYIDDIVDGLMVLPGLSGYDVVNLGSGNPISINTLIQTISEVTGKDIQRNELELQAGDVRATFADNSKAKELLDWEPKWNLKDGIAETVKWFRETELEVDK